MMNTSAGGWRVGTEEDAPCNGTSTNTPFVYGGAGWSCGYLPMCRLTTQRIARRSRP